MLARDAVHFSIVVFLAEYKPYFTAYLRKKLFFKIEKNSKSGW